MNLKEAETETESEQGQSTSRNVKPEPQPSPVISGSASNTARVKKGVVLSDDDENKEPVLKAKPKRKSMSALPDLDILSDTERSVRAMMDIDDCMCSLALRSIRQHVINYSLNGANSRSHKSLAPNARNIKRLCSYGGRRRRRGRRQRDV